MKIGIVAPSSRVPAIEFKMGLARLKDAGFDVKAHPSCLKVSGFFASDDAVRAAAFFEYAKDPEIDAIWCARGGYGAVRLLPLLDQMVRERGIPNPKLLIGYSDSTALAFYTRERWGWKNLHAVMPGLRDFCTLKPSEWKDTVGLASEKNYPVSYSLKWAIPPQQSIRAELMGGNLSVITSLLGTPYSPQMKGKILFIEETAEALYRIDRMIQQLIQSRALEGTRAVVLGNFLDCRDKVGGGLKSVPSPKQMGRVLRSPKPTELKPIRPLLNEKKKIIEMFSELARALDVPLGYGLPSGHGPEHAPLLMGAQHELSAAGRMTLVR